MNSKRSKPEFDFHGRAAEVEAAQLGVTETFAKMVDRTNRSDPATRAWLDAIERFRGAIDAAYPPGFWKALHGLRAGDPSGLETVIRFLEADPYFFRSGYVKEKALKFVGRGGLEKAQAKRLRAVCLAVVDGCDRREFRNFCRLAGRLATPGLLSALETRATSSHEGVRRRAGWMAEALKQSLAQRDRA